MRLPRGGPPRARLDAPANTTLPGFSAPPSDPVRHNAGNANGLAIGSLVCGIAGFLVGLTAPVAVVLGIIALNQPGIDSGSRTMAIIGIVFGALVTVGGILAFMFVASFFGGF